MINQSTIIILTFIVTGIYDFILRYMNMNDILTNDFKFIKSLTDYYKQETLLTVVLTAGFVGAMAQLPILVITKVLVKLFPRVYPSIILLTVTFITSALFGFVMKLSKLFPSLDKTYYKTLGWKHAMLTDGVSGLIVNLTLLPILLPFIKD